MTSHDQPSGTPSAIPPAPLRPASSPWQRLWQRWWIYARWVVVAIPLLLLGLMLGAGLYVFTHAEVFTGSDVVERPEAGTSSFTWPLRLTHRVNLLLIGVDVTLNTRRQVVPISRSDTLMVISFDPDRDRISALSIPRDVQATIPGVGLNKINGAYAFGGPSLTIRTVEDLLGIPVHYYVKLGPASFARIIDAIGGIDIDVEKDMKYTDRWAGLYIDLKQGRQLLDGEHAMHYIRFRHDLQGDLGRVHRQQKVLLAVFQKLKSPATVLAAPQLLRAFVENTQTNLTMTELITLGWFALRLEVADVQVATLPGQVGPVYVIPDMAKGRQLITQLFFGVDPDMLASTTIEILNGSGVPGLGRQTAERLQRLGLHIVRVDTAPTRVAQTTVIDRAGRPEVARLVAEILGRKPVTREPGAGADITVLVARDLASAHRAIAAARH